MQGNSERSYGQLLGDLYARWTLDPLIEHAHAVSKDFVARPEFYKQDGVADGIVELRIEYGTKSGLPNLLQRQEIAFPVFGASDGYVSEGSDKFRALRKPLFDACAIFSERSVADSAAAMRQAILSALGLFQPYLKSFDGLSLRRSHEQVVAISELAFAILRSRGVGHVFGVAPPGSTWPLDSNDASGALLVRGIGEKLALAPQIMLNEERFQRLRRVAQQGREALVAILDPGDSPESQAAQITAVYTWSISLRDIGAK